MKHFFLLAITLWVSYLAKSQNPFCGSDYLPTDPAAQALHDQLEQQAFKYFSVHQQAVADAPQAVLTIPVVVHIIHNNGPENISDAQVQQAILWLNAAYANTGYFDQGSGTEVGIQFCLAQRTPDGLVTNGITRDQNVLTNLTQETQDLALKNINRWEPKQYLNIWLVHDICSTSAGCGVVGYAYRPEYHGTQRDGLVIEAQFFGAVQSQMSVAAHEIGHYLGLYHTFEGGCTNNNCLIDGDRICDTPPDQSTAAVPCGQSVNTCSTDTQSGFTTDQPDMTSNFLDYGDINCFHDFTPGQAERMNFYLNGIRHSLLDSKGCLPPCLASVVSAFTPSATTVAPGQAVTFTNASQNAATYQWAVNGTPFSTLANPSYIFNAPGTYTIVLLAQPANTDLCEAVTSQVVIQVVCATSVVSAFTPSTTIVNAGQSVSFTNNSQNAQTYQWSIDGILFSTSFNSAHTFSTLGTYTVTLLAQSSAPFCNTDTSKVTIQVVCNVVADFTLSNQNPAENERITLTNTSQNATDFSWTINGVAQADTITTLTFTEAGIYNIQLTASNGVCQNSLQQQVLVQDSCVDKTFQIIYSNSQEFTKATATAQLTDGGTIFVISRYFTDSINPHSFYLVKLKPDGSNWWMQAAPTSISNWDCHNVAATSDGCFILGLTDLTNKHGYISKWNAEGQIEWGRSFQETETSIVDIEVNNNQEIMVVGASFLNLSTGSFFAKFGASGQLLWANRFMSPPGEYWQRLASVPDGGLVAIGHQGGMFTHALRMDANGNILWRKRIGTIYSGSSNDIIVKDSSIYLCGNNTTNPIWLMKTNLSGQTIWVRPYAYGLKLHRIIWADEGLTLIGGYAENASVAGLLDQKGFIAHLDYSGTLLWSHTYSLARNRLNDLIYNSNGYWMGGEVQDSSSGIWSAWILKMDRLGFAGNCATISLPIDTFPAPIFYNANQNIVETQAIEVTAATLSLINFSITPTLLCESLPQNPGNLRQQHR